MPAIAWSCRFVSVMPSNRAAVTASSKNISKKSPSRKSSRVSRGSPRFTSKYCCIIGVSLAASTDIGETEVETTKDMKDTKKLTQSCVRDFFVCSVSFVATLFHRDLGGADHPPLVLIHGMLGSSRNWQTAGRDLAAKYHVLAPDLRNHGASPHEAE